MIATSTTPLELPPPDELESLIIELKQTRNAVILAHYYQESDIQDLADFIGDSLALAQQAKQTNADMIVFCGVHFMAETAKILNPKTTVVLPDLNAGCSLADACPADLFAHWLKKYPDHTVISYINCSAEVKALSDIICTSSNAVSIVKQIGDKPIVFAPDKHLGAFIAKQTNRDDIVMWQGSCIVHETFSEKRLLQCKTKYPTAKIIAHPECQQQILRHADYIASTTGLLNYVKESTEDAFIIATEAGILHKMRQEAPNKTLIPAPPEDETCACNLCPYMRLNTLEKLYLCMRDATPQIHINPDIQSQALLPIERMLEMSV